MCAPQAPGFQDCWAGKIISSSHGAANGAELTQACQPGMPAGPGTPKNWASIQNRPQAKQMPSPCPISPGPKLTKDYLGDLTWKCSGLNPDSSLRVGVTNGWDSLWCRELNHVQGKCTTHCTFWPPHTLPTVLSRCLLLPAHCTISRPPLVLVFFQTLSCGSSWGEAISQSLTGVLLQAHRQPESANGSLRGQRRYWSQTQLKGRHPQQPFCQPLRACGLG